MTLPVSMYMFGAGVYDKILYIFDGSSKFIEYNASFDYNINSNVVWNSRNMPAIYFGISSPTYLYFKGQNSVQIGTIVYGTFPETDCLNYRTMLKYSVINRSYIDTDAYESVSDNSRSNGACAAFNPQLNILYSLSKYSEYYNISSDTWTYISDPNEDASTCGCAMDINSQFIFKFGGYGNNGYVDVVEKYNVGNDSWMIVDAVLQKPLVVLRCLLYENVDDKIYCTGGNDGEYYTADVHVFDTQSLTIDYVSYELNVGRGYHLMLLYDECIFVMGGYNNDTLKSIEYLCLNSASDFPSVNPTIIPSATSIIPSISPTLFTLTNKPTIFPSSDIPTLDPTLIPIEKQNSDNGGNETMLIFIVISGCTFICGFLLAICIILCWKKLKAEDQKAFSAPKLNEEPPGINFRSLASNSSNFNQHQLSFNISENRILSEIAAGRDCFDVDIQMADALEKSKISNNGKGNDNILITAGKDIEFNASKDGNDKYKFINNAGEGGNEDSNSSAYEDMYNNQSIHETTDGVVLAAEEEETAYI